MRIGYLLVDIIFIAIVVISLYSAYKVGVRSGREEVKRKRVRRKTS